MSDRPGDPTLEELRARLEERRRRETEEVVRRLSADVGPCRCCSCVEADVLSWEEREGRRGRWSGY